MNENQTTKGQIFEKPIANAVGAHDCARNSRGITLVALIITIIVMLILVGVSISIAINGGLFDITKRAAKETENAKNAEQALANGRVKIDETWYDSIEDYVNDNPSKNQEEGGGENPPDEKKDTQAPKVMFNPNGGNYTVISGRSTRISTIITAIDPEETETSLQSGLATLEYAWSTSNSEEPTNWETFTNGNTVEKTDITEAGTWYLWTKVTDNAGNRAEEGKVSKGFTVTALIGAPTVKENAILYYGSAITGYNVGGVSEWRIFYADESNIYLIADAYISSAQAPASAGGNTLYVNDSDSYLSFTSNVINDYTGSEWIRNNSKAKRWLGKYLNAYPNSTNENIRAVAYMMDTNVWSKFAGNRAEYAIGGPTLELFCASYKDTHPDKYIECDSVIEKGYQVKWNDATDTYSSILGGLPRDDFDSIYSGFIWLASPAGDEDDPIYLYSIEGTSLYCSETAYDSLSLRPIICLKYDATLTRVSDGVYSID